MLARPARGASISFFVCSVVMMLMFKWMLRPFQFFFNTGWCRAPPGLPRLCTRATPILHASTRCHRRKNRSQLPTRRAEGVEKSPLGNGLLGRRYGAVHR